MDEKEAPQLSNVYRTQISLSCAWISGSFKDIAVTTQICSMLLVKINLKQFVKNLKL